MKLPARDLVRLSPEVERVVRKKLKPLSGRLLDAAQKGILNVYRSGKVMTSDLWVVEYSEAIDRAVEGERFFRFATSQLYLGRDGTIVGAVDSRACWSLLFEHEFDLSDGERLALAEKRRAERLLAEPTLLTPRKPAKPLIQTTSPTPEPTRAAIASAAESRPVCEFRHTWKDNVCAVCGEALGAFYDAQVAAKKRQRVGGAPSYQKQLGGLYDYGLMMSERLRLGRHEGDRMQAVWEAR